MAPQTRVRMEILILVALGINTASGLITVIAPTFFDVDFRKNYLGRAVLLIFHARSLCVHPADARLPLTHALHAQTAGAPDQHHELTPTYSCARRCNARRGVAVAMLVCYYSAPLSAMYAVFTTRSANSLNFPLCIASTINGVLWMGYGLARRDMFLAVPNAIGAAFGLFQLACILVFRGGPAPSTTRQAPAGPLASGNGVFLKPEAEVPASKSAGFSKGGGAGASIARAEAAHDNAPAMDGVADVIINGEAGGEGASQC